MDPIPTLVLKETSYLLEPFIAELFNRSLITGHFLDEFKHAFITPIVKKAGLDSSDVGSYRPISNLSVLSKLCERVVARQVRNYLQHFSLLPSLQSDFHPGQSTETAILRVMSDLFASVDRGDFAALILLDLSTAFNTVDRGILLQRLKRTFGFDGQVLSWFSSLNACTACVRRGSDCSEVTKLICGVPQGSVLRPLLFILFTVDLQVLIESHEMALHLNADDDTQIYGSCNPSHVGEFTNKVMGCIDQVSLWMRSNRLQPNEDKTGLIWFTTSHRQHQLPLDGMVIGGHVITPKLSVRNLGVIFDADLSMSRHVDFIAGRCFGVLRQL